MKAKLCNNPAFIELEGVTFSVPSTQAHVIIRAINTTDILYKALARIDNELHTPNPSILLMQSIVKEALTEYISNG